MTDGAEVIEPGAPAEGALAEEKKRVPLWGKLGIGAAIVMTIVVIAGFVIHVPYSTISPGEAVPLTSMVRVTGTKTFNTPRGDIRLLFVRERNHVNLWRYLQAKLDSDTEIFKETQLNPTGASQPDLDAEATADMALAKINATAVALRAAGYTVKPASEGVVVLAALASRPAGKVLKTDDVILTADGVPLHQTADLRKAIGKHKAGEKVKFDILRGGKPQSVEVPVEVVKGTPSIGVIVSPRFDFPVTVDVDTAGIGGPSGGLAMTLAILDDLTAGNITGGERVAVTGTIDADGNVGEIGGIEQKAVAARAAGAKLFIVPECGAQDTPAQLDGCKKDLAKAMKRAGSKVKVVPVSTFADALRVLRENGGDPVTPAAQTTRAA